MGVELTFMPLWSPKSDLAHDMIDIGKNYELFALIEALPSKTIEEPIWCFRARLPNGENTYGQLEEDPYGKRLNTVTSTDLLSIKNHPSVNDYWRVRAAWAYIDAMPEDWPIVLYWH